MDLQMYTPKYSSRPAFLKFFEVGTSFLSQKSFADHLTLVPFGSKIIISVAYFNIPVYLYFKVEWIN